MSKREFIPLKESMNIKKENNYRKLTPQELKLLGFVFSTDKYKEHIDFARQYYPKEATSLVLVINSEYNDSAYNNTIAYVIVYNKQGDELPPLKETAKECRKKWFELSIPGTRESNEHIDDIVISLSNIVPELYIKE